MPLEFNHLVGRQFIHGKQDCFSLARDFYKDNFGIEIPNYARPDFWWDRGMNLYADLFYDHGFRPISSRPQDWRLGDAVLMAIRSKVGNHCGIFVEPGKILHHMAGRLSTVEPYRGTWRNTTLMVLRNKDVQVSSLPTGTVNLMDILPDGIRHKLTSQVPSA